MFTNEEAEKLVKGCWDRLWRKIGQKWVGHGILMYQVDRAFSLIKKLYNEPFRHYHNFTHIAYCFGLLDDIERLNLEIIKIDSIDNLELALIMHDIIYNPLSQQNEEMSANMADWLIKKIYGEIDWAIDDIKPLIMSTRISAEAKTNDQMIMQDIDNGILGAEPKIYDEYERKIWKEYAWVRPELFKAGRKEFLEGILKKEHIFNTNYFRTKYEIQARDNIRRSLERLNALERKQNKIKESSVMTKDIMDKITRDCNSLLGDPLDD
jgi:predicted metal-dependent HD superfamily phosphohydrolase